MLAREEFAEKLDISSSVVFITLKKLVYDVDLWRENRSFLLVRKKFDQSRRVDLANDGVGEV